MTTSSSSLWGATQLAEVAGASGRASLAELELSNEEHWQGDKEELYRAGCAKQDEVRNWVQTLTGYLKSAQKLPGFKKVEKKEAGLSGDPSAPSGSSGPSGPSRAAGVSQVQKKPAAASEPLEAGPESKGVEARPDSGDRKV